MKQDQSIVYHRKRTADNLLWIVVIIAIVGAMIFSSCSTQRSGCKMTAGYVGYGNR
jgi:hypothetical protein